MERFAKTVNAKPSILVVSQGSQHVSGWLVLIAFRNREAYLASALSMVKLQVLSCKVVSKSISDNRAGTGVIFFWFWCRKRCSYCHWPCNWWMQRVREANIYIFTLRRCLNWLFSTKKWSFPLRISSVDVTKVAGDYNFDHITDEIVNGKLFCAVLYCCISTQDSLTRNL